MPRPLLVPPGQAAVALIATFLFGYFAGSIRNTAGAPPPSPPALSAHELRGPPTKAELGQAGWTLLHVMAANTPEKPTEQESARVDAFLHALGHLYPCPTCAAHFRQHIQQHPIASSSREALSLWLCEAHNEVNIRNGKKSFYCDIGVLDARWKDCGCGGSNKTNSAESATPVALLPSAAWERRANRRHGNRHQRTPLDAAAHTP